MILGDVCTRNCGFCGVEKGVPLPLDVDESRRIAAASTRLGLNHVVVTSVTRDDLPDQGAEHFARTIKEIRSLNKATIEVLIPDFQGSLRLIETVVNAKPDIINHNVETVPRLYPKVRPKAVYGRSLKLLNTVKDLDPRIYTKSGLMVGLGESGEEILDVMTDLRSVRCGILTIGQYLQPSKKHREVKEYVQPEKFEEYKRKGEEMGFIFVASAPLVRSSFNAAEVYACISPEKPF